MNDYSLGKSIATILMIVGAILGLSLILGGFYVIDPGHRGVAVTLGNVDPQFKDEGLGFKTPWITSIIQVPIKQQSHALNAPCFSSDLQTMQISLQVLFRYPESNVVELYQEYNLNVIEGVLNPKFQESIKEVTAQSSAEQCVKNREMIKGLALDKIRKKLDGLLTVEDLIITNIDLSKELEKAIEQKMVQEQEAAKAKFKLQQAQIDAQTAVVRAEGEAKAVRIRNEALRDGSGAIDLLIAEKWDGKAPQVIGSGAGVQMLLPLRSTNHKEK